MKSTTLCVGDWVRIRTKQEILSTLDENGCLDGLPFMPEMLAFCGRRLRVYKRAHKTCDSIHYSGTRRMVGTVHLEQVRCDGQAHGGCQANCLIFWKEAWMTRAEADEAAPPPTPVSTMGQDWVESGCEEKRLHACTRRHGSSLEDEVSYVCQATQLLEASTPLPWWNLGQYWEDYTSGNFGLRSMAGIVFYAGYNNLMKRGGRLKLPAFLLWLYNAVQRVRGRPRHPRAKGNIPAGGRTPSAALNLQPGERVRVKGFDSVLDTIDRNYCNRGMKWDAEMVPYCGGTFTVTQRVEQCIDEKTGRMITFKTPSVILEGVTCQSRYSDRRYFCPRSSVAFWREVWLERVPDDSTTAQAVAHSNR